MVCYKSLNKIKDLEFDLVVLDECHRITPNNSKFFKNNKVLNILGLTATPPKEEYKVEILNQIGLKTVYELPLDKAVNLGLVAPYKIVVIEVPLDNKDKYIKAGNKKVVFYNTEQAQYNYLSKLIQKAMFTTDEIPKFLFLNRMRFIYNLKSKTMAAKKLLDELPKDDRILIFHKSVERIEELCKHTFHSKVSDAAYKMFVNGKIRRLGVVDKVNEGDNIPNLDKAVIVQLNSQPRELIQRIGRVIRKREGHEAVIYILVSKGTKDESWLNKALESFSNETIEIKKVNE